MEILTLATFSISVKRGEVAGLIGVEDLRRAALPSARASMQNSVFMVFDKRHDTTLRLAQSMIATR